MDRFELILGLSTKRVRTLQEEGILAFNQLLDLENSFFLEKLHLNSNDEINGLKQRIELYLDHSVYVEELVFLPHPKKVIFFDVEASPFRGRRLFLVSFASGDGEIHTFVEKKDNNLLKEINAYLKTTENQILVSLSGSNWDFTYLRKLMNVRFRRSDNGLSNKQGLDLFTQLQKKIITPVGFSVKKFSAFLGYPDPLDVFTDPRVSPYLESYRQFVKPGKSGYFMGAVFNDGKYDEKFLESMIDYNSYDVDALRFIYKQIYSLMSKKQLGKIKV